MKSPKSKSRSRKTAAEKEDAAKEKEVADGEETEPKPSADVVSLDSFRKNKSYLFTKILNAPVEEIFFRRFAVWDFI